MRYLPLTDADRRDMLAKIGAKSIEELYRDVPQAARLGAKIAGLPDHLGELEVERAFQAYAAKNLAWWIGALPNLFFVFTAGNAKAAAYSLFALCGWTAIYALRAITEERHLLLTDNGYAAYATRVKWRFIPGVV